MERKIGEIFEYNGEWYQCIIGHCNQCSFDEAGTCKFIGNPYCAYRNDKKLACFKKLEKVGEPIEAARGLYFQRYQLADSTAFYEGDTRLFFNAPTKTFVYIEIKTKEDMEEKKLNLKPFDIQKAREGKPVCTRDGRKARIICFDAKGDYPIVALIESGNIEGVQQYMIDGHCTKAMSECYGDLMMLPEKKEGWVNVYALNTCYSSKEEAEANIDQDYEHEYVITVKIEWEE
jgi:hypothetical protein